MRPFLSRQANHYDSLIIRQKAPVEGAHFCNRGEGEIRTPGALSDTQPFQGCRLNRSRTSPDEQSIYHIGARSYTDTILIQRRLPLQQQQFLYPLLTVLLLSLTQTPFQVFCTQVRMQ